MKYNHDIDLLKHELKNFLLHKVQSDSLGTADDESSMYYRIDDKHVIYWDGTDYKKLLNEDDATALVGGLQFKQDARVATTVNQRIPQDIKIGGVIQGITLADGDAVLLMGQTNAAENGLWVVGATTQRSPDMNESQKFNNAIIYVVEGDLGGASYRCKTLNPIIDTDPIEFTVFSSGAKQATETVSGIAKISTAVLVQEGIDDKTIVTPLKLKSVTDAIWAELAKLRPAKPAGLAGKVFTVSSYTALRESTGTADECVDSVRPTLTINSFYDGDAGTLVAEIDAVQVGSKVLSVSDDTGTYAALRIVSDVDPYAGQGIGKEGFYKVLTASITPVNDLSLGAHTFRLSHSTTGVSELRTLHVDDPQTVTITDAIVKLPPFATQAEQDANYSWISGVPSIKAGVNIGVTYNIVNAVRRHYSNLYVATVSGAQINTVNQNTPSTPQTTGAIIPGSQNVQVQANRFSDKSLNISIVGYNSKKVPGTVCNIAKVVHIDTVSNESARKISGSGDYPTTFGADWLESDSKRSLKTDLTEELQMLNGLYQRPAGKYDDLEAIVGPDYSSGMGTGYRWVTFKLAGISNKSGFILTFNGTQGTWSGTGGNITSGIIIRSKVEGAGGTPYWMDCNAPYDGVSNPGSAPNGDPANNAMVADTNSTYVIKKVTFGKVTRTGDLYVRIGLPDASTKKFASVTITSY